MDGYGDNCGGIVLRRDFRERLKIVEVGEYANVGHLH